MRSSPAGRPPPYQLASVPPSTHREASNITYRSHTTTFYPLSLSKILSFPNNCGSPFPVRILDLRFNVANVTHTHAHIIPKYIYSYEVVPSPNSTIIVSECTIVWMALNYSSLFFFCVCNSCPCTYTPFNIHIYILLYSHTCSHSPRGSLFSLYTHIHTHSHTKYARERMLAMCTPRIQLQFSLPGRVAIASLVSLSSSNSKRKYCARSGRVLLAESGSRFIRNTSVLFPYTHRYIVRASNE